MSCSAQHALWPSPRHALGSPRALASSHALRSLSFSRCGTSRLPVPRRFAASPRASRSTSARSGRGELPLAARTLPHTHRRARGGSSSDAARHTAGAPPRSIGCGGCERCCTCAQAHATHAPLHATLVGSCRNEAYNSTRSADSPSASAGKIAPGHAALRGNQPRAGAALRGNQQSASQLLRKQSTMCTARAAASLLPTPPQLSASPGREHRQHLHPPRSPHPHRLTPPR